MKRTATVEYAVDTTVEHPRTILNARAAEGYVLHSILTGWFDRFDVWQAIGYTMIFTRPLAPTNGKANAAGKATTEEAQCA